MPKYEFRQDQPDLTAGHMHMIGRLFETSKPQTEVRQSRRNTQTILASLRREFEPQGRPADFFNRSYR